jgi:hypothetical protein
MEQVNTRCGKKDKSLMTNVSRGADHYHWAISSSGECRSLLHDTQPEICKAVRKITNIIRNDKQFATEYKN